MTISLESSEYRAGLAPQAEYLAAQIVETLA